MAVTRVPPTGRCAGAIAKTCRKSKLPKTRQMRNSATRNPKSPIRLTMKAYLPASALAFSVNQKPISRYEQRPTPSHPMNIIGKFAPNTSTSMNATKRLR